MTPTCAACGSPMKKHTHSTGGCSGAMMGLGCILLGLGSLVLCFPFGFIVCPVLCIVGGVAAGKTQKFWRCRGCGAAIARL